MKLWKILLATMIALVLVCAVAMADDAKTCADEGYSCNGEFVYVTYETCDTDGLKAWNTCTRTKCANHGKLNMSVTQVVPAYGHDWKVARVLEEPTCTEDGLLLDKCQRTHCGEERERVYAALGHDLKVTSNTNSTCKEAGVKKEACQRCDYKVETVKEMPEHVWVAKGHKEPTHEDEGYDYFECSGCGSNKKDNKVPAQGHDFEYKSTVAPTCTTKGYDIWKCECGEREEKNETPALGHNYVVFVNTNKEPTCTADGENTYQCDRAGCGATTKVKLGKIDHTYATTWTTTVTPTCTVDGEESRYCLVCGGARETRVLEATGHSMKALTVTVQPTCTTAGERVMGCRYCTYQVAEVVPATDHEWTNDKNPQIAKAATCTEDGLWTWKCQNNCGETKTKVLPKLGHDYKETYKVEPTCDRAGLKTITCKREGCKFVDDNIVVMPTGHDGKVTEYVAPTCTAEGSKTTECESCGKTVTETIAKLPHDYEWEHAVKPSMAGDGKDVYICQACDHIADTKVIKYTKWYYNNTMTSFGPTTKELVGGNDWYRVTPIDVTVDGVYTYDLIASNRFVVGSVTITVNAGVLTVSYDVAASHIDVKDEAMYIYASKADLAAGTAVTANVGAAINVAETFGDDAKVIVSLVLTGDYNAAGHNVSSMIIDDAEIAAMIANID